MRITIDAALREQHGERDDDCEMDQRHEEERGLHRGAKLLPTGTKSGDTPGAELKSIRCFSYQPTPLQQPELASID